MQEDEELEAGLGYVARSFLKNHKSLKSMKPTVKKRTSHFSSEQNPPNVLTEAEDTSLDSRFPQRAKLSLCLALRSWYRAAEGGSGGVGLQGS